MLNNLKSKFLKFGNFLFNIIKFDKKVVEYNSMDMLVIGQIILLIN